LGILNSSKEKLNRIKNTINKFLKNNLSLELHQDKSKILTLEQGIPFLGFRIFHHHKLLKKSNIQKIERNLDLFEEQLKQDLINYDKIYTSFQSWLSYTTKANTFNLRA